ncbi:MAG: GNAT family N-acetyltransferase [Caulobacter sp.]|nr:GNAT family N-acetyltransferase [Caulobacter sp.]
MKIDVVSASELSSEISARWSTAQAADARFDSPFLSPRWVAAVDRAQGPASGVRVAIQRDMAGDPAAFLAVRRRGSTAMPVGAPMCDYQAIVTRDGFPADARAMLRALEVSRFDFCHMLEEDPAFAGHERGRNTSWVIEVPDGYAAYEAQRREAGVGVLKDIDKKRRKAEREVGPSRFTALSDSRADFDQLVAWKRAQLAATGQTDLFRTPWVMRLIEELRETRDADFGGGLYTLHLGDELAAAHFHLRGGGTIHGWLIAHDPRFERYSPGLMLFQDILRTLGPDGYRRLDLGAGDYRFKRELSNRQQMVTFGFLGAPSISTLTRNAAYQMRHVAETLPLGRFSALPGKAMRRIDVIRGLR